MSTPPSSSTTTPSSTSSTSSTPATTTSPPSPSPSITISPARTPTDLSTAAHLFKTYAASLPIDISYQSFAQELASLPGAYSPERGGEILLARSYSSTNTSKPPSIENLQKSSALPNDDNPTIESIPDTTVLGCVALRRLPSPPETPTCEMKRLYTIPSARGTGLGTSLATAIIQTALENGYKIMKLDTLSSMAAARALYKRLGFVETEAYNETPVKETLFYEKVL